MSKNFPWKTMMLWHAWPKELGWTGGRRRVNMSGCPHCDFQTLSETICELKEKAENMTPFPDKEHAFAAILTLYSEKKGDVEIIDFIQHAPAEAKRTKKGGVSMLEIIWPPEVLAFDRKICKAFPELCGDFIEELESK